MIDFENKNWFEDPSKDQEQKEYFDNYLEAVGLTWEDLENKKVLDMGAGLAGFGKEAQERNVDVTSLEKNPDLWKEEGSPTQETPYVQGDAAELPFRDESFDIIISRAAPPILADDKEQVRKVIREAKRVLKEKGEFHFGPGNLDAGIFSHRELSREAGRDFEGLNTDDRIEAIKQRSIKFLKSIDPNIERIDKEEPGEEEEQKFFVLKKPEKENIQEHIQKLEELKIGPAPKAEVMLILLGEKPATELDVYPWNDDMENIKRSLKETGLSFEEQEIGEEEGNRTGHLIISRSEDELKELSQLDPSRDHEEYGRLMGYPETAIQAFKNKEQLLPEKDYPDMEDIVFNYKLSRDNWEEEWQLLKHWSDSIKEYSPETFHDLKRK